jgi:hypothetical protein
MSHIIVMQHQGQRGNEAIRTRFDTDAVHIGIEKCISDDPSHFIGAIKIGTLRW